MSDRVLQAHVRLVESGLGLIDRALSALQTRLLLGLIVTQGVLRRERAIERLGAVKEGILRNCKVMPDGSFRHSVYYSIIESEWQQVKVGLEAKMRRA